MTHPYVEDSQFGRIIDYDQLRQGVKPVMDQVFPEFNLLGTAAAATQAFADEPNYMTACAASGLAYMMLVAAEEHELAAQHQHDIFTLGWTEEHCGTDLLSIRTQATPLSDDPNERNFHIKGAKWLINNSFHADYHMVLAKIDPEQSGPRSMSIFLVPHSSTQNWQRLDTHVLQHMVLTQYEIDGPGVLIGKRGHGLTILQRMAMPSKYQCSYLGMAMLREAIPATIAHLDQKRIFGNHPIRFSNVFRQLYNLALQAALLNFMYFRAMAFSDSNLLQFHGTMLKSFLLLRANELLGQNLLVAGSKGFLRESPIGRNAKDSFVLPVFDGHYTLNTLMTEKYAEQYLNATLPADPAQRIAHMRATMYQALPGRQIYSTSRELRRPDFYDFAAYVKALKLPPSVAFDADDLMGRCRALVDEIKARELDGEAEYKYKLGSLVHRAEAVMVACEMWATLEDDRYLNAIPQTYNHFVVLFNEIVAEGALATPFMSFQRQLPLPSFGEDEEPAAFLLDLLNVEARINALRPETA